MSRQEFEELFPDDDACARHLAKLRWGDGFRCPTSYDPNTQNRIKEVVDQLSGKSCGSLDLEALSFLSHFGGGDRVRARFRASDVKPIFIGPPGWR